MRIIMGCLTTLMLLVGCGSTPPGWFLANNQPESRFYGVGMGDNFELAKQVAIDDLAQSIRTQVRSSTHIHNSQQDDSYSTKLSQHIELDSATLTLQNLQIINTAYKQGKYYVQVGISKEHLLAPLRTELQEILSPATYLSTATPNCLTLKDFGILESSINRASSVVQILSTLRYSPPKLFDKLSNLYAQSPKPTLKVRYNGLSPTQIATLSAEISKLATITENTAPTLIISAKTTNNAKIATLTLQVTLMDCAQIAVFQTMITERQASPEYALKRAGIVLYKKLHALMRDDDGFPTI